MSKSDPHDFKQELARLGYVLNIEKSLSPVKNYDSPSKRINKLTNKLGLFTLEELLERVENSEHL